LVSNSNLCTQTDRQTDRRVHTDTDKYKNSACCRWRVNKKYLPVGHSGIIKLLDICQCTCFGGLYYIWRDGIQMAHSANSCQV